MSTNRLTLRLVAAIVVAMVIPACGRCFGQAFEDLSRDARNEFKSARAELAALRHEFDEVQRRAERNDPLLRRARAYREEAERKRLAAQTCIREDQDNYAGSGRGTLSQFEHWQCHFANAASIPIIEEKLADPRVSPLLLWDMRFQLEMAQRSGVDNPPPGLPSKNRIDGLSADDLLQSYREWGAASFERSHQAVDAIEPRVRPTQHEREHVLDYEWWTGIKRACDDYIEASTPQESHALAREILLLSNRLTSIWPGWKDAEFARTSQARQSADE